MKKLVAFLLITCLLIPTLSFAEGSDKDAFSFRNGIILGMTQAQIEECEGKAPSAENGNYILYTNESAAGKIATILYDMSDSATLTSIGVIFSEEHTNPNAYIDDFDSIDNSLTAKYGLPETSNTYEWSNSLYKDDEQYYGLAVSLGYLKITSSWDYDGITIFHRLDGDNYKFSHVIIYKGPTMATKTDTSGV